VPSTIPAVAAADTEAFARCEECDRTWDDPAEPWRADWIDDDDLRFWCPVCWHREFDDD